MHEELIALRLSAELLERLDAYVQELQKSEPRFQITRSSAIRDLIAKLPRAAEGKHGAKGRGRLGG